MVGCLSVAFGVDFESPLLPVDPKGVTILDVEHFVAVIVEFICVVDVLRVYFIPAW